MPSANPGNLLLGFNGFLEESGVGDLDLSLQALPMS